MSSVFLLWGLETHEAPKLMAVCASKELAEDALEKYKNFVINADEEIYEKVFIQNGFCDQPAVDRYLVQHLGEWAVGLSVFNIKHKFSIEEVPLRR